MFVHKGFVKNVLLQYYSWPDINRSALGDNLTSRAHIHVPIHGGTVHHEVSTQQMSHKKNCDVTSW